MNGTIQLSLKDYEELKAKEKDLKRREEELRDNMLKTRYVTSPFKLPHGLVSKEWKTNDEMFQILIDLLNKKTQEADLETGNDSLLFTQRRELEQYRRVKKMTIGQFRNWKARGCKEEW